MAEKWNLVDLLSEQNSEDPASGKRRRFYLPFASVPPGMADINRTITVNKNLFHPEDGQLIPHDFPFFNIEIKLPPGSHFSDDGVLPDPAIRLHAISDGFITFKPATDPTKNSLILEILILQFYQLMLSKVKWWRRWVEAGCIPHTIIYENINKAHLALLLNTIQAPITGSSDVNGESIFGLKFPVELTQDDKPNFIAEFLAGNQETFLRAEAGAYIGKVAAKDPAEANNPNSDKKLSIKVLYHDHTDSQPHMMNPRELFHLLFGDKSIDYGGSYEARNHPLLLRINEVGQSQNDRIESKRMLLRPPLRTWARLRWEADQEVTVEEYRKQWGRYIDGDELQGDQVIGSDRFYLSREHTIGVLSGRGFFDGPYNENKCNLFVSDICLRAGYRVRALIDDNDYVAYYRVGDYANNAIKFVDYRDKEGYAEIRNSNGKLWGRKWALKFVRIDLGSDRTEELNRMMKEEGRCFILLLHRLDGTSGHIAIVKLALKDPEEMGRSPLWRKPPANGLNKLKAQYYEAVLDGAKDREMYRRIIPYYDLFLVELCPGKDPDTLSGLADLIVLN